MAKSHNKSLAGTNHHRFIKGYFFFPRWRAGSVFLQLPVILRTTHSGEFLKEEIILLLILSSTLELILRTTGEYQESDCQTVGLSWKRQHPRASHGASPCAFINSPWAYSSTKVFTDKLILTFRFKFRNASQGARCSFINDEDLCTFL